MTLATLTLTETDAVPVDVPAALVLPALMTWTAAMLRLPVERMPASPASTKPFGAMIDVAGSDSRHGGENADAAAGGETREVRLDGGALWIDEHAGRRGGFDGL